MKENYHIAYWSFYNHERSEKKRKGLMNELVQTIIYNLVINYGPQSENDIYCYFNVQRIGRKGIRRNLNKLLTENWGHDSLLVYKEKKIHLNDTIVEEGESAAIAVRARAADKDNLRFS